MSYLPNIVTKLIDTWNQLFSHIFLLFDKECQSLGVTLKQT